MPVQFDHWILDARSIVPLHGEVLLITFVDKEKALLPHRSRVEELTK